VARTPSIRLRAARVNQVILARIERKLEADPKYIPTEAESRIMLNLGKLDAILRDRATSKEEEEDNEDKEKRQETQAKDLVATLTNARKANPTAKAFRGEDDNDDHR
jgi:hypothetical protein